jgi:asparagine synthase (glutamine-hydrolysing)
MCGIFGIVARNASVAPGLLERATLSLAHRGPDDSGTVIIRDTLPEPVEVGFGSRRLAVLDLSPLGHQPMRDPESGNWIVYNGEIYNFRAIRKKLENEGARFAGNSDTEVLLKAYARWGERCLDELRGMFAFAIWDAQRHRLFLARDPMGIKPLYYCTVGPYFLFASEIRTLLHTGLIPRRMDRAGLSNYLAFGSLYDPITLIEGVSALRPGHYLTWEREHVRDVKYWDLAPPAENVCPAPANRKQFQEDVYATLTEAVRLQTVSDVPVGVFLSGGIDSSSLAGILRNGGADVDTFSIVFRESGYNEAEYSRMVAKAFGTCHHEVLVSQHDALEAIPFALRAMDQPSIDGLNTFLIARQTRAAGIKVALSGLGGDELFAGYSSFRDVPRMERFARICSAFPGVLRKPLARIFCLVASDTDQNRKLTALVASNTSHPYFLYRGLFTPGGRSSLLKSVGGQDITRADAVLRTNLESARDLDPINRVSYLEARCYMLNTLLRDADVMSMAHGLEVRVPLIDHLLAAKLLALPGAWKLDNHTPKPLLVNALKGALPDEIVHRKKSGFTLPFERWMRDELHSEVGRGLQNMATGPLALLLDASAVQEVWNGFNKGTTSWSRPWSLYVLQRWCEVNSVEV